MATSYSLFFIYSKNYYVLSNHFKTKVNIYVMVKSHDIKPGSDNFQYSHNKQLIIIIL